MTVFEQITAKLAEKTDKMSVFENLKCLSMADAKSLNILKLFLKEGKVFAEVKSRFEGRHYIREITAEDFIFDQYVSLKDGKSATLRKEILANL